jgi:RNA polymerase sigma-70 factor, ECF subfamily
VTEQEERFRRVFDGCYQPLCAFARRRVSAGDADDLVAEVLTVAWRRLDDIPADAALPWLYGVARKVLANQHRSQGRRQRLVRRVADAGRAQPREFEPETSDDSPVMDALRRLRSDDREILRLAAWEQLGPSELAVVLGCTTNAAALRLSRARRRLREQLTRIDPTWTGQDRKVTDA